MVWPGVKCMVSVVSAERYSAAILDDLIGLERGVLLAAVLAEVGASARGDLVGGSLRHDDSGAGEFLEAGEPAHMFPMRMGVQHDLDIGHLVAELFDVLLDPLGFLGAGGVQENQPVRGFKQEGSDLGMTDPPDVADHAERIVPDVFVVGSFGDGNFKFFGLGSRRAAGQEKSSKQSTGEQRRSGAQRGGKHLDSMQLHTITS